MRSQYVLAMLLALSALANLGLIYGSIDQAIGLDHCHSEAERRGHQLDVAAKLFRPVVKDQSSEALLRTASRERLDILRKGEDEIYVEQIKFTLTDGRVSDFAFE
ncbi:MAG: hypothetical protein ACJ8FF_02510 [Sphingomicrobium sp.]